MSANEPAVNLPSIEKSTPLSWRFGILLLVVGGAAIAYLAQPYLTNRIQSGIGVLFFIGIVAAFSANLRRVNWKTIGWGIALQFLLAVLVLKARVHVGGKTYSVYGAFERMGDAVKTFISFSDQGSEFVFGNLSRPDHMANVFGSDFLFPFAFKALPPILFMSAFFTLLYHFGILQVLVKLLARIMTFLMQTSGAETLSVSANVFMGQTEAPLIVKPYVPRMTNSELFTLMTSGMAHISGGLMAVYINYGADPVAVLTTCIMACPCSLYLSKLMMPEISHPETAGDTKIEQGKSAYVNAIDAIASGTTDGLRLALNVAAMLIVFVAFVAMINGGLSLIPTARLNEIYDWKLPERISLEWIFGQLFSPLAFLVGVDAPDQADVGSLLGQKLVMNEHFAYLQMKKHLVDPDFLNPRSRQLVAFALTGFANFSSVGIQLGGIGAMAPDRRADLARLGMKALFVGFIATMLNASVAGLFL